MTPTSTPNPSSRRRLAAAVAGAIACVGAIAVTAAGAQPRPIAKVAADSPQVADVRAYGAVGDGKTDCSPAFQRALDALAAYPQAVLYVPPGEYRLASRVSVDRGDKPWALAIRGDGPDVSTLIGDNADGVFTFAFGLPVTPNLVVTGLSFVTDRPAAGTAFEVTVTPGGNRHDRSVILRDVEIRSLDILKAYFDKGVVVRGAWRPLFDNVSFGAPYGPGVSADYSDESPLFFADVAFDVSEAYQPTFQNTYAWSCRTAYRYRSEDEHGGPEGGVWQNAYAVEVGVGIDYYSPGAEPHIDIDSCHINARDVGIRLHNKRYFTITDCLFYNVDGLDGIPERFHHPSKIEPRPYKDIELINCTGGVVSDNLFHFPSNPKRVMIDASEGGGDVMIHGNYFNGGGTALQAKGLRLPIVFSDNILTEKVARAVVADSGQVIERDNLSRSPGDAQARGTRP